MDRLGFDLEDGTGSLSGGTMTVCGADAGTSDEHRLVPAAAVSAQEARRRSIQTCLQSLVHACHCRDANCRLIACQKMKRLIQHSGACRRKNAGGCPVCKQLIALCCYHAKTCDMPKCPVPYCCAIKEKLERQRAEQRLKQAQLMRRRMAAMQRAMTVESAGGIETAVPPTLMPSSVVAQPPPTNLRDKNAQFVGMGHTVPVSPAGVSPYHRAVQSPFGVAASQQPVYDRRQSYTVISTTSSQLTLNRPVAGQSLDNMAGIEMMTSAAEFSSGGAMLRERNEAVMLQQRHASVPVSSLYGLTQHVRTQSRAIIPEF